MGAFALSCQSTRAAEGGASLPFSLGLPRHQPKWRVAAPAAPSAQHSGVCLCSEWGKQGMLPAGALVCLIPGPQPGTLTPVPPPPGCRKAGDRLTPICSRWEPHCSDAVYCIRGMLSSNQLSGRPSPDLIPTLVRLCACSALTRETGRAGPQQCSPWTNPSCWEVVPPVALVGHDWPLSAQNTWLVAGGGPAALGMPVSPPWRGAALGVAQLAGEVHVGAEVLGLVQVQVGGSNSQPPSPAAIPVTLLVLRSCSWAERPHRVLGPAVSTRPPYCNAECCHCCHLLPCVCRPRNVRWPFAYSLATACGFLCFAEIKGGRAYIFCSA